VRSISATIAINFFIGFLALSFCHGPLIGASCCLAFEWIECLLLYNTFVAS
jgi:hypothetical protein